MNDDILDGREIPAEEQEQLKEKIIDVDADKLKFYEDLRQKAKGWTNSKGGAWGGKLGEYLFLLPDFFILVARLALDKRVPSKQKLMAGGIVAYLIMPIDLIPDFIPVIGHVDDLVLVVLGLNICRRRGGKHHAFHQRIAGQAIGAMQPRISSLAHGIQTRHIGAALQIGVDAAAGVVRRGHNGYGVAGDVYAQAQQSFIDIGEMAFYKISRLVADV